MTLSIPTPPAYSAASEAFCLAVTGSAGGIGTTSLAVEIGYQILKNKLAGKQERSTTGAPRVCIMDLDFETGALSTALDVLPAIQAEVLVTDPSRIDASMTSAQVARHASGLDILAAPMSLDGNKRANADCVLALMDAASTLYDVLILDVPRFWQDWTQAALLGADKTLMITEISVPSLHSARNRIEQIESRVQSENPDHNARPIDIVVNKYERRSFRASISAKDAATALGRPITGFVCTDPETSRSARNYGQAAGSIHAGTRYVKDIAAISRKIMTQIDMSASNLDAAHSPPRPDRRKRRAARA